MHATRRDFLLLAGKGTILAAALPLFHACGAPQRESTNPDYESADLRKLLNRDHFEILRYASLAPSGHNTQPWEVEIMGPGRWQIKSNPERWLPAVDPENREGTLSMGPFIENLVLAAGSYGYRVEVNPVATSLKASTIAEVVVTKSGRSDFPFRHIALRRTVRKGHLKKAIRPADIRFITGNDDANFHYYPADSAAGKLLAEGTLAANKIQTYRDAAQSELSEWIRFSNTDARKYRNGLTPASMELPGFAALFARIFYDKENVMSKGFREKGIELVGEQVNGCGGWMVITSPRSDAKSLLETGRKFQRMFLKTREKMIAVHPMTQLLEEGFTGQVQSGLGLSEPAQFILRTSYLEKYPDPVSLRRPVAWFTYKN